MNTWRKALLGDELELAYGKALPAHTREPGKIDVFGSNGLVGRHSTAAVNGPGIIVGRKGSVGEVTFSQDPFWPIDTTYFVVKKGDHDWRFLYYLLLYADLTGLNSHSAIPGLNREDVYSITASFPPRNEETKIAEVLDCIQTGSSLELKAENLTATFKLTAMRDLFTRGLRGNPQKETEIGPVPENWTFGRLSDHFSVASGGTPSRANPKYWQGGTIPWVKTTEIDYGVICDTQEHITPIGLRDSAAKMLPSGTLLMAMYGQGVTRGKVAILGLEAACNQACAAIAPTDESVQPKFLFHFLSYQYQEIRRMAHGGQQQNLNSEIVRNLPLVYPSDSAEQTEIIAILDAINIKLNLHRRKQKVLHGLFKTLLHKLMNGDINVWNLDLSALPTANKLQEVLI